MDSDPIVSILLPVCDAVSYLPACLRSIRRQTEPRFECLVVDDGSRDGSADVARAAASEDARIRVLARPHQGLVPALNAGITHFGEHLDLEWSKFEDLLATNVTSVVQLATLFAAHLRDRSVEHVEQVEGLDVEIHLAGFDLRNI